MTHQPKALPATRFSVLYRKRDGKGSYTWKDGLTEAEARAELRWCFNRITDAFMVWTLEQGNSSAVEILDRELAGT